MCAAIIGVIRSCLVCQAQTPHKTEGALRVGGSTIVESVLLDIITYTYMYARGTHHVLVEGLLFPAK